MAGTKVCKIPPITRHTETNCLSGIWQVLVLVTSGQQNVFYDETAVCAWNKDKISSSVDNTIKRVCIISMNHALTSYSFLHLNYNIDTWNHQSSWFTITSHMRQFTIPFNGQKCMWSWECLFNMPLVGGRVGYGWLTTTSSHPQTFQTNKPSMQGFSLFVLFHITKWNKQYF